MLVAYIDCFGGLSGDTLLEALFDAGLSREQVDRALTRLSPEEPHDNGATNKADLDTFRKAMTGSALPTVVKQAASAVLIRLHEAESAAHKADTGRQEWDGSELRAAIGVVLGLSLLGIGRVECSSLRVGGPVVAKVGGAGTSRLTFSPITAEIVCHASIPVYGSDQDRELVTPVGAALVATLASNFGPLPSMTIRAVGYGKDRGEANNSTQHPRQTRLIVGERASTEVAPAPLRNTRPQTSQVKLDTVPRVPVPLASAPTAREETATATNGTKAIPSASPYIALVEEWVALSIKGHQESGRQRL